MVSRISVYGFLIKNNSSPSPKVREMIISRGIPAAKGSPESVCVRQKQIVDSELRQTTLGLWRILPYRCREVPDAA